MLRKLKVRPIGSNLPKKLAVIELIPINNLPQNSAEILEEEIEKRMCQINILFRECSEIIPDPTKQVKELFKEFSSLAPKGQHTKTMMAKAKDIFEKIQTLEEEIWRLKDLKLKFETGHRNFSAYCNFVQKLKKIAEEIKQSHIFFENMDEIYLRIVKKIQEEQMKELKFSDLYQMVCFVLLLNFYCDNTLRTFFWKAGSPPSKNPGPSSETIEKLRPIYRLLNEYFTRSFHEYEKNLEDIMTQFNQSRTKILELIRNVSFDNVSDFIEQNRNNGRLIKSLNELERKVDMNSSIRFEKNKPIIADMEKFLTENTISGPDGDKSKPTYSDVQIRCRQMNCPPNYFLDRIKVYFCL